MYASSVWAPAANKISAQKHLNVVQRGFAQKIARAYRTVSLNAALVLSGLLPLDLRIQEAAQLYEAKRGRPAPDQKDRQLEGRVSFLRAPHPAGEVDIEFECLNDMLPETLRHHQMPDTQVFTDGSKIDGKVGAAVTCWKKGSEILTKKLKLESYCTVFQAELYALHQAVEIVHKRTEKTVAVLSDSRSSLELVQSPDTFHPLAFAIRRRIAELMGKGRKIQLYWVKAHVGIPGNERADELARQAAQNLKVSAHYDRCPVSFVKSEIRRDTCHKWNKRYTEGQTAHVTKIFLPNVAIARKIVNKRSFKPIMTQVVTGHGGFAAYLHRFKLKDSPSCVCEDEREETILHLLLECPKYGMARHDLESATNIKLTESTLCTMLTGKESRSRLERYCALVAGDAIKRNATRTPSSDSRRRDGGLGTVGTSASGRSAPALTQND